MVCIRFTREKIFCKYFEGRNQFELSIKISNLQDIGAVILTNGRATDLSAEIQNYILDPTESNFNITQETNISAILQSFDALKVRKNFYDSFFWRSTHMSDKSVALVFDEVPSQLTKWVITGISLSETYGLAITEVPSNLTVNSKFYMEVYLPYSVKQGEIWEMNLLLHNNLNGAENVTIEFDNSQSEFEALDCHCLNWTKIEKTNGFTQTVLVEGSSVMSVKLKLKINNVGLLPIDITATFQNVTNSVEKKLKSLPLGRSAFSNQVKIVNNFFNSSTSMTSNNISMKLDVPEDAIKNTVQVEFKVVGDALAATLNNLNNLVRKPTACGEQNMLNFVPNVVLLDYLTVTNQLTPENHEKILTHIELGYQKQLNFRKTDGSFSAFGNLDGNGSTWLTAYAVRYFRKAQSYIDIEENVIEGALNYIISKQDPLTGRFVEDGIIFHKQLQKSKSGIALTAYVVIALLENVKIYPQFAENIHKAFDYIENNYDRSDIYSLALVTYAFFLDSFEHSETFNEFYESAKETEEYFYWEYKNSQYQQQSKSQNIEITAYGLLILAEVPELGFDAMKILNWLIAQRNSIGGFESTQDSVLAIEAIAKFSSRFVNKNVASEVTLHVEDGVKFSLHHEDSLHEQGYWV